MNESNIINNSDTKENYKNESLSYPHTKKKVIPKPTT